MIIIDASVAIKLLNENETDSARAFSLYEDHLEQRESILVLDLLFIETANALATKKIATEADIEKGIRFLMQSKFKVHKIAEEELIEAAVLAKKYDTSVYDMLYAVVARNLNVILITADGKFAALVKFPYVKVL